MQNKIYCGVKHLVQSFIQRLSCKLSRSQTDAQNKIVDCIEVNPGYQSSYCLSQYSLYLKDTFPA